MTDYLGVTSVADDVGQTTVTGYDYFQGEGPYTLDFITPGLEGDYSDDITINVPAGAPAFHGSNGEAAVARYGSLSYRTTFWGFPFPAIPAGTEREEAMRAVLSFCKPHVLLVDDDDNAPDVRGSYTAALDALDVDYQVWDTANSDNEPDFGDMLGIPRSPGLPVARTTARPARVRPRKAISAPIPPASADGCPSAHRITWTGAPVIRTAARCPPRRTSCRTTWDWHRSSSTRDTPM